MGWIFFDYDSNVPDGFVKLTLTGLTRDASNIDVNEILSCWRWKVADLQEVLVILALGDLFFAGQDAGVYWLQTNSGNIKKVADGFQQFVLFLNDENKVQEWFLPLLVEKLITSGKTLKNDDVYSYLKHPGIGGDYAADNIIPLNIAAHFSFSANFANR